MDAMGDGNDSKPAPDLAEEEEMFADLNSILVTSVLLFMVMVGYWANTGRLKNVPESGFAMIIGLILGGGVRFLKLMAEEEVMNFNGPLFFYVLLPPIIFEAGLSLERKYFMKNLVAILAYAVVGTLLSTWITSNGLQWMAAQGADIIGLDVNAPRLPILCHLFGSLISATDPVATIALFGGSRFKADKTLHALVNGESLLNDAVAIALFTTLMQHLNDEDPQLISQAVLGHFTFISVFSLILGLWAGAFMSWVFKRSTFLRNYPHSEISAMTLGAYLTFAVAQLLGLSGIVALFFFGVVLSAYNSYNLSKESKVASHVTFETLAKISESAVFIYLGCVTALSIGKFHWHFTLIAFTILVITVARAAHVFPLTLLLNACRGRGERISLNLTVVLWISGLRGAIAFALALRLPCPEQRGHEECKNTDLLVTTTISIVMATTLIVGTAMEKIMMRFAVIELASPLSPGENMTASLGSDAHDPHDGHDGHHDDEEDEENLVPTGWLGQTLARLDAEVLKPVLGGPRQRKPRVFAREAEDGDVQLPSIEHYVGGDVPDWKKTEGETLSAVQPKAGRKDSFQMLD